MYKCKVWIHKNLEEILKNKGPYAIDFTFMDEPKNGDIIRVTKEMTKDLSDEFLWNKDYGPGNYIIESATNMFNPKIHDGFSYCIMALKVE
jgi:acyl-ACP thioesterase